MGELTIGCIKAMRESSVGQHQSVQNTVQIYAIKEIKDQSGNVRYRGTLTDGVDCLHSIFGKECSTLVSNEEVVPGSIIKLTDFTLNEMAGAKLAILLKLEIIQRDAAIVTPMNLAPPPMQRQPQQQQPQQQPQQQHTYNQMPQNGQGAASQSQGATSSVYGNSGTFGGTNKPRGAVAPNMVDDNMQTMPIVALNPYNNNWTIKARITKKSDMRTWSNANGSGNLFSVDLLDDQNSEIKGTFFKQDADKWFNQLQEGMVYRFHGGKVKPIRDRRYSTLNNQYEITFDASTNIAGPIQTDTIKTVSYNFRKISEISEIEVGQIIDVLGFVKEADAECATITSQKLGGRELFKRDLSIVDDSGCTIKLTLWGDKARSTDVDWQQKPIIAAKSVKIGDYNGRSLSILNNSSLSINPEIDEAMNLFNHVLQNFGGGDPNNMDLNASLNALATNSLSAGGGGGGGGDRDSYMNRRTVSAIKDEGLGFGEKSDYSNLKMSLIYCKKEGGNPEGPWYLSCPNPDGCKRKVTESMAGAGYRCEKCDREWPECKRRYILSTQMGDASGAQWFTFFNEEAEKLLGISADDLHRMKLDSEDAFKEHFDKLLFKEIIATVRSKAETMNDGPARVKSTIFKYSDINYVDENRRMIEAIKKYIEV